MPRQPSTLFALHTQQQPFVLAFEREAWHVTFPGHCCELDVHGSRIEAQAIARCYFSLFLMPGAPFAHAGLSECEKLDLAEREAAIEIEVQQCRMDALLYGATRWGACLCPRRRTSGPLSGWGDFPSGRPQVLQRRPGRLTRLLHPPACRSTHQRPHRRPSLRSINRNLQSLMNTATALKPRLELKPQEPPLNDPDSCNRFVPRQDKPFLATSGAIHEFGQDTVFACLRILQTKAAQHDGIDYLQIFISPDGARLWFIEDSEGGAITALLPEEY